MDDKDLQTPSQDASDSSNGIPRNIIMPGAKPSASFSDPVLQGGATFGQAETETSPVNIIPVRQAPVAAPVIEVQRTVQELSAEIPEVDTEIKASPMNAMPLHETLAGPVVKVAPTSAIPLRDIPVIKPRVADVPVAMPVEMARPESPRLSYVPDNEQATQETNVPDIEIPALRTYKNDIGRTVETDKITTAKILLAEQKKQDKQKAFVPETSVKKPKNILALLLGLLFTAGAIGVVGFFVYTKIIPKTPGITFNTSSFFLFAFDREEPVDVGRSKGEVFANVNTVIASAAQGKENAYTDIVFYKNDPVTEVASRISTTDFFKLYEVELPTNIARSVSKDFVYGLHKKGTNVEPFVVIGLVDFENAFGSMFAWEPTLAIDMKEFFPRLQELFADNPEVPLEIPVATTTATSTNASSTVATTVGTTTVASSTPGVATSTASTTVPAYKPINRNVQFVDVVLANRDTRALRDENGTPYFYYTFIDRDKILFAQDPSLIPDIVRKIREKQLVR